jgi:putative membrane protein
VFAFVTRWLVTAILLKITDAFSDNLTIRSFGTALIASGAITVLGAIGEQALRPTFLGW